MWARRNRFAYSGLDITEYVAENGAIGQLGQKLALDDRDSGFSAIAALVEKRILKLNPSVAPGSCYWNGLRLVSSGISFEWRQRHVHRDSTPISRHQQLVSGKLR